ncbi:MAG TPA: hypothetical protein VIP11_05820, partial [Gemmatimonadaceae bacterium]
FAHMPIVSTREPLWTDGVKPGPDLDEGRLTPRTSVLDANPERPVRLPAENIWTVVMSVAALATFTALLVRWNWIAAVCGAITLFSAARWMWPSPTPALEARR